MSETPEKFLSGLTIKGFKSICSLKEFPLKSLNVIIGANGSGKSNFVEFFSIVSAMMRINGLKEYIVGNADDFLMKPSLLSDGSLRFIALATALLQPEPPSIIIIDEPELGLHPHAVAILTELFILASEETQIIVATQSPEFINHFAIEDIIVAKREEGASTFKRLEKKDFSAWLEDDTVGELWTKNIIQAGSTYE